MANVFSFTKNKSVVREGVEWPNQITQTQSSISFSSTDISLSDSLNDTYATADGDNETQYLSVLETSQDNTLEDINNLTLSNQTLDPQDNNGLDNDTEQDNNFTLADSGEHQVVLFNVEGSDEIYGIQLAQDEEGNVHKYQFQFRKTEDGQLEAMPETVQLLTNEEENQESTVEPTNELEGQPEHNIIETPVYLKEDLEDKSFLPENEENAKEVESPNIYEEQEYIPPEDDGDNQVVVFIKGEQVEEQEEIQCEETLDEDYEESNETIDIKPGIDPAKIKQELLFDKGHDLQECEDSELESQEEITIENMNENCLSDAESYSTTETNENEETILAYQQFDAQNIEVYEDTETMDGQENPIVERYERILIEQKNSDDEEAQKDQLETIDEDANVLIVEKDHEAEGSDNEDYELVEGVPVTGDEEISESNSSTVYQEPEVIFTDTERFSQIISEEKKSVQKTTNILKQPTNTMKTNDNEKNAILYYMVSNTDQKENLNSLSNSRSLLKNNLEIVPNNENLKRIHREKLLERRYAKSKVAIQAKMFNNFINKTTIPHAPVRQTRLPRKQLIEPVDTRRNEEIIVQEVMVSSKGFVESISERLKGLDKLEITSIVELSDSDEDYTPKNSTKKKKKYKKTKPTNQGDSEDSDASVIEILQSDEEPEINKMCKNSVKPKKGVEDNLKRTRGRPSKSGEETSPQKKSRTEESSELDSDNGKKEISCPHCPKTFPNQNSLSTHIQHHNLENSMLCSKKYPPLEYKHKCIRCQETFKNGILLKRHVCKSNISALKHKCGICSKYFKDLVTFNIHKKSHIKENMAKSTNTVSISPKKFLPRPSTSGFKAPANVGSSFKCKECSKVLLSQSLLSLHEKSHKKFVCITCNINFNSKLLLDTHVRIKCVKPLSPPKNRRLSFKTRRSYVHSPRRTSIISRKSLKPPVKTSGTPKKSFMDPKSTKNIPRINIVKPDNMPKKSCSSSGVKSSRTSRSHLNSGLDKSKSVNMGLNTSSMIRTLEVEAQCDSCPQKFTSFTDLFKHKVKNHGLSTPDKKVLEPKKKTIHKPHKVHGGIPAQDRLTKAFEEMRKNLISAKTDELDTKKQ